MALDKTVVQDDKELKGWLIVLNGEWKGKDYPLFEGKTVVGSNHFADIYLPDRGMENFHFSIRVSNGEIIITDLDSETGLTIDGKRFYREKIVDETIFETPDMAFLIKML